VSQVVLLDTGSLGLVTNPRRSQQSVACAQWLQALVAHGLRVIVPEIADYEVRRELLRAKKERGLARLDALASRLEYLPLTTAAMRQATLFPPSAYSGLASSLHTYPGGFGGVDLDFTFSQSPAIATT